MKQEQTLTRNQLKRLTAEILSPLSNWAKQCHHASLTIVKRLGYGRVARGFCKGVDGQHSWVVLGDNCHDPKATIIDPTLWSYDDTIRGVWVGTLESGKHQPHGMGSIWAYGRPPYPTSQIVKLTPKFALSADALHFLELVGDLDRTGWHYLVARCPVEDWPAGEIIAAVDDTEGLSVLVPIDRLGMLTDRNPGGLYLPIK